MWSAMLGVVAVAAAQDADDAEDTSESGDLLSQMEEAESNAMPDEPGKGLGQLTLRGGYARYYSLDFITGGADLAVRVFGQAHAVAGLEAYAVNRTLPPEVQLETGEFSRWEVLTPFHLGGLVKFPMGALEPYGGAELLAVNYLAGAWAIGGRVRGGVDYMFTPNVGLNANLSVGAWSGDRWGEVESLVQNVGVLPQVTVGVVGAL